MKHLKKVVALALVCIFAVGMLSACGGSGGNTPAGSAATGSGAVAYPDTGEYTGPAMTLTVNFASPDYNNVYMMDAFERITARTGGKVTFEPYYISGLLSLTEALDGLGNGLADISDITLSNYPAQFVYTTQLCALPFAGYQDILSANDIVREVILNEDNAMMMQEFTAQNIKPFATSAIYGSALICHNDINIEKPEDLKGLKIMTQDIVFSNFLNSVGAVPVSHQVLDMTTDLQNGVVDVAFNGANVAKAFGAIDYTKVLYKFETDLSTHIKTCCINLDVYNSFNDELKKIWDEETGDKMYQDFRAFVDKSEQEQWAGFDENPNLDVRVISNDMIPEWKDAIMPFAEAQLDELKTDHPDLDAARKIWEDAITNYYAAN